MPLKEKIIADLTAAMKAREELKTSTLRMAKAAIMKYEVSGANKVATDAVVTDLLKKEVKMRHEAAAGFTQGGNSAMAEKELKEAAILQAYLPEQLSEQEVRVVVKEAIDQLSAGPGDFGKLMGKVMGELKGRADGGMINRVAKEMLAC